MIGKLAGRYAGEAGNGAILLDANGVGYEVRVPPADIIDAELREGDPLELFIHTAVRDDAIDLYGFPTREELSFFKLLMSVSGIGPKTALSILTVADVPSLKRAVAAGDATVLTKVYGIGKESAERIIVELKDKLAKEQVLSGDVTDGVHISAETDVLEALEALGYSAAESRRALKAVPRDTTDVRQKLAAALKELGTPANKTGYVQP